MQEEKKRWRPRTEPEEHQHLKVGWRRRGQRLEENPEGDFTETEKKKGCFIEGVIKGGDAIKG